jgi:hypothetical protein
MKKPKPFDAVAMRNRIQAQLRKEHEGLSDEEIERRRRAWLDTSDDPAAKWWRSIQRARQSS